MLWADISSILLTIPEFSWLDFSGSTKCLTGNMTRGMAPVVDCRLTRLEEKLTTTTKLVTRAGRRNNLCGHHTHWESKKQPDARVVKQSERVSEKSVDGIKERYQVARQPMSSFNWAVLAA